MLSLRGTRPKRINEADSVFVIVTAFHYALRSWRPFI